MRLGTTEIILIVVLALVIFGGSRLSGVGKALGTSIREFKQEVKAADDDDKGKDEKEDGGYRLLLHSVCPSAPFPERAGGGKPVPCGRTGLSRGFFIFRSSR